jgi:hypothetical protein
MVGDTSRPRPAGEQRRPFFNSVILVVDKEGDVPDWLLINNPRIEYLRSSEPVLVASFIRTRVIKARGFRTSHVSIRYMIRVIGRLRSCYRWQAKLPVQSNRPAAVLLARRTVLNALQRQMNCMFSPR